MCPVNGKVSEASTNEIIATPVRLFRLACSPAPAQISSPSRQPRSYIGPPGRRKTFVRKGIFADLAGRPHVRAVVDDDPVTLYLTGQFYNIRVTAIASYTLDGVVVTYILEGNPKLTAIKFQGNKKYKDAKLQKKITSKVGELAQRTQTLHRRAEIQRDDRRRVTPARW